MIFDEIAPDDTTNILWKYYCKRCEEFFFLSPLAPLRCPICFVHAGEILGPIPIREIDISKIKRRYENK